MSLLSFSSLCQGLASLCTVAASQLSGQKWHAWTLWDFKRFSCIQCLCFFIQRVSCILDSVVFSCQEANFDQIIWSCWRLISFQGWAGCAAQSRSAPGKVPGRKSSFQCKWCTSDRQRSSSSGLKFWLKKTCDLWRGGSLLTYASSNSKPLSRADSAQKSVALECRSRAALRFGDFVAESLVTLAPDARMLGHGRIWIHTDIFPRNLPTVRLKMDLPGVHLCEVLVLTSEIAVNKTDERFRRNINFRGKKVGMG